MTKIYYSTLAIALTFLSLLIYAEESNANNLNQFDCEIAQQAQIWPEVLTLEEAACYLRIESQVVKDLVSKKEVPGRAVGGQWLFSRLALLNWLTGDWEKSSIVYDEPELLEDHTGVAVVGRGTTASENDQSQPSPGSTNEPIGEAPEKRTAQEIFLRGQSILLAPGEVNLDLGLFYSRSDDQTLSVVGAGIGLATIEQDVITPVLIGRYGLFEETELFASTSYQYQQTNIFFGSTELSDTSRSEFGDINLGLRRTLLHENLGIPNVIFSIDGRIPTGDSSYAAGGGFAFTKSIDPAVLFASTNYQHTFSREFSDISRLEAEDQFDITLGMALALNDSLTMSIAFSGLFASETDFANARLRSQESYSMRFGLTSLLTEDLYIEPTISYGLNGSDNSFVFGINMPYTFTP